VTLRRMRYVSGEPGAQRGTWQFRLNRHDTEPEAQAKDAKHGVGSEGVSRDATHPLRRQAGLAAELVGERVGWPRRNLAGLGLED
jgi:hypothetical protein